MKCCLLWLLMLVSACAQPCPFGYFNAFGDRNDSNTLSECVECLTPCSQCMGLDDECEGCAAGFYLPQNQSQCFSCENGVLQCDNGTNICQPVYKHKDSECKPICQVENCLSCSSLNKKCDQCISSYHLEKENTLCLKKYYPDLGPIYFNNDPSFSFNNDPSFSFNNDPFFNDPFPNFPSPPSWPFLRSTGNLIISDATPLSQSTSQTDLPATNQTKNCETVPFNLVNEERSEGQCQDCPVGQYYQKATSQCLNCSLACLTCIYSADQCLECGDEYVKKGWKCITKDHLTFELTITLNNNTLQAGINRMKYEMIGDNGSDINSQIGDKMRRRVTVEKAEYLEDDKVRLFGYIDKQDGKSLSQAIKIFSRNIRVKQLGPFSVEAYNVTPTLPPTDDDKRKKNKSLSGALIAMIVIVSLIVFLMVLAVCIICYKKHRKSQAKKPENNVPAPQDQPNFEKNNYFPDARLSDRPLANPL